MKSSNQILRTPEKAFQNLKEYPFTPNYIKVDGIRMHYVDEGKNNQKVIFLLHGQPSWSYLYRHMIPEFVAKGYRVIAPDLIGFGKSDKPTNQDLHTFSNHVKWMEQFVKQLGIKHAAAFMQDWGGMIGLRVLAHLPEWLDRLVVANTALAEVKGIGKWMLPNVLKLMASLSGKPSISKFEAKQNYGNWAGYFKKSAQLDIGKIIQVLTTKTLRLEEMEAYNAPFPTPEYYAGPRRMPEIVATDLDNVGKDWERLKNWNKPVLTLFSDKDPFLAGRGYDKKFQQNFSGAKEQPHITIQNASHFLQEDQSQMLANKMIQWLAQTKF